MNQVALKMLFGDRAKYFGLVFGVAFATLLITQQASMFVGIMARTSSFIGDVKEANIWVMDSSVKYVDTVYPLRDTELQRIRGVPGVAWAVPIFRAQAPVRTRNGSLENARIIGLDDASLIGVPRNTLLGNLQDLRDPDAVAIDGEGYRLLWPDEPLELNKVIEINDHRAVIRVIVDAAIPFTTSPQFFTRYSLALRYTNNGRNALSFVVARSVPEQTPEAVAAAIAAQTGLQALTRAEFQWKTVTYYLKNTGIPINFGLVIVLGVIVGVAVVGLTFNMFVAENIKQYAALKAIGVKNSRLLRMVLIQAMVVGLIGYGLGTGMAAAFFEFATRGHSPLRGFFLPWQVALSVAVLDGLIMFVSTLFSLRQVFRVDPAVVFRG